jgi:hypothetical protein
MRDKMPLNCDNIARLQVSGKRIRPSLQNCNISKEWKAPLPVTFA